MEIGQLKAGDTIEFVAVSLDGLENESPPQSSTTIPPTTACHPSPSVRQATALLVEYGEQMLDIALRFRVHALMQRLEAYPQEGRLELTPGIRSLLEIHFDNHLCPRQQLPERIVAADKDLGDLQNAKVPSRTVWLPLSWDDSACREAITRYTQSVRPGAPWCPSNIEFIRRINGLDSVDEVKRLSLMPVT